MHQVRLHRLWRRQSQRTESVTSAPASNARNGESAELPPICGGALEERITAPRPPRRSPPRGESATEELMGPMHIQPLTRSAARRGARGRAGARGGADALSPHWIAAGPAAVSALHQLLSIPSSWIEEPRR